MSQTGSGNAETPAENQQNSEASTDQSRNADSNARLTSSSSSSSVSNRSANTATSSGSTGATGGQSFVQRPTATERERRSTTAVCNAPSTSSAVVRYNESVGESGNQQVPPPEELAVVNQVVTSLAAASVSSVTVNCISNNGGGASSSAAASSGNNNNNSAVVPKIRRVRSDYCASNTTVYNSPGLNIPQSRLSIVIPVGGGNGGGVNESTHLNIVESSKRKDRRNSSSPGATLRERNAKMLFNELMSDVCFLVGEQGERIPAHSYLLAVGSTVFYAMFYTDFPKYEEIELSDVEPQAFRILLTYLYTDSIELNADSVMNTLYVAKKYLVTHLIDACIEFLTVTLNASNVCMLLSQSRFFEETELMQRCWEIIDAQSGLALKSSGFLEIDSDTLTEIVYRETLQVDEPTLFACVIDWAKQQCRRQELDPTSVDDVRSVLGDIFYQIRIPAMRIEDFANVVAKSGYLTYKETTDVFVYLTANDKPSLPFVCHPRRGLQLHRCHRFQSSAYRSNQWRYRGRCDSVQFACNRRVFVAGFGLYGSSNGASDYKVSIELKHNDQVLGKTKQEFVCDGSSDVFPVYFSQPIQIEPHVFYTANACLDGVELSYFGQEGMPETQCADVAFQFQCSSESTNGTGVQGGQLPEIMFYMGAE